MDGKTQTIRDKVVLLLVTGMSAEAAEAFCVQNGTGLEGAKQTVSEARNRLTVAAAKGTHGLAAIDPAVTPALLRAPSSMW